MQTPEAVNTPAAPALNVRTKWWLEHKDEPRIVECMRAARRKYYYKNQEREKARGLEYYYKRKAAKEAAETSATTPAS